MQVSSDVSTKLRIIYGGSVNDKNANDLASQVRWHNFFGLLLMERADAKDFVAGA